MTFAPAWGHDGKSYSGKDMRQAIALTGRGVQGVGNFAELAVSAQSTPNNTVKVAPGRALIPASAAGLFGQYAVSNDGDTNSPAFTATGAQARTDRVILRVDASGNVNIEIVAGTPGPGTPPPPTVTGNNFLVLARVQIPASTTNITNAMIVDERELLPQGGLRFTALQLVFWPAGLGDINTDPTTKLQSVYNGAAWVPNNNNIVKRQKLTTNSPIYGGDDTTDFVLNDVPVRSDRLYKVHFHSAYEILAVGRYLINLHVDGVLVDRFADINEPGFIDSLIEGHVLWEPATGTPDLSIRLDYISGTGTLQFIGTGTTARWFWVEDIGPR